MVEELSKLPNVDVLAEPIINQAVVSFRDPSGAISDEWNEQVIAAIDKEGTSFFSGTTFQGRRAMRISVSNWQTDMDDVKRTVVGVKSAIQAILPQTAAAKK
jgi:glutamate/tyrosine decarboxylase-like PLP-dependent enzyme